MPHPRHLLVLAIIAVFTTACGDSKTAETAQPHPAWLATLITRLQTQSALGTPDAIYRYHYQNQAVYYLPAACCDLPSTLYDSAGRYLCAPEGGFHGQGDGRCADFATTRTDQRIVWQRQP